MSRVAAESAKSNSSNSSSAASASKSSLVLIKAKIQKAIEYKEKGNAAFKLKKYKKAIRMYHFMFAYITGLPGQSMKGEAGGMANFLQGGNDGKKSEMTEEETSEISELLTTANLNISSSYIKLKDYENALKFGKAALSEDPKRWKAHLRIGQAYMLRKDCENAKESLQCALSMQGGTEKYILKELKKLKQLERKEEEKAKKQFRGIFEKL